jgi:hypothetical protein
MTPEDLLRDRHKVIAPYPGSPFKVGQILEKHKFLSGKWHVPNFHYDPADYPAIFQPLPWWSDRAVEEMPEFVKGGGNYYKHQYAMMDGVLKFNQECNGHLIGWLPVNKEFSFYEPVSVEEYKSVKQSNK